MSDLECDRTPDWYPDPADSQDEAPPHLRLEIRPNARRGGGYHLEGDRAAEIGVLHTNAKAALKATRRFVLERRYTARIRLFCPEGTLWQTDEISAARTVTTTRHHAPSASARTLPPPPGSAQPCRSRTTW